MRVISPLLKRVVYPCLARSGILGNFVHTGLAVITYHGVLPPPFRRIDRGLDGNLVTPETFRRQLRFLKANYSVISPNQMLLWLRSEQDLPPRAVILTCDDGLLNNLTEMVPILQDEGVQCLFFVTGASLGRDRTMLWYEELLVLLLRAPAGRFGITFERLNFTGVLGDREQRRALWWKWVKWLSQTDQESRKNFLRTAQSCFGLDDSLEFLLATHSGAGPQFGLLTRKELRQLAGTGMTIGGHTSSHPMLSQLPVESAWFEISRSRKELEAALGQAIWAFAYPFGDSASVTPAIIAMTKQAGFEAAFLNGGGGLNIPLPAYSLPRVHVNADMGIDEFEAHVSGFFEMMQRWVRRAPHNNAQDEESVPLPQLRTNTPVGDVTQEMEQTKPDCLVPI